MRMDRSVTRTRTRRPAARSGLRALLPALAGVIVLLSGVAAVVTPPAPAGAVTPPAPGWTTVEAPLPTDAGNGSTNPDVYTSSSVCPAANGCVTVGWYKDTAGKAWGLIESQSGTTWTETEAPQPNNAGSGSDQGLWIGSQNCGIFQPCHAVSCPSATSCVAVGQYLDTAGYSEPVVETLSGGSWSATEAPLPSDTATDTGPVFPDSFLFSVSCASTTSCVAVGCTGTRATTTCRSSTRSRGRPGAPSPRPCPRTPWRRPRRSRRSSTACRVPRPRSAPPPASSRTPARAINGLLVTLANGTWTAQTAPQPSDSGNDGDGLQDTFLTGLSCASVAACTAVGTYIDATDHSHGLIDSFNGGAWTAATAPIPSNAGNGSVFEQLAAVSCPSPDILQRSRAVHRHQRQGVGLDRHPGRRHLDGDPGTAAVQCVARGEINPRCSTTSHARRRPSAWPPASTTRPTAAGPATSRRATSRPCRPGRGAPWRQRYRRTPPLAPARTRWPGRPPATHRWRARSAATTRTPGTRRASSIRSPASRATGSAPPTEGSSPTPTRSSTARRAACS